MNIPKIFSLLILSFYLFACGGSSDSSENTDVNIEENTSENNTETENPTSQEGDAEELSEEGYQRYGIESGQITYKLSGFQNGTQTIYFDQWGMREAIYLEYAIEMAGIKQEIKQVIISDGEWIYTVDLIRKLGTKAKNREYEKIIENAGTKDLGELGKEILEGMGGKKVGEEEFLGKNCDVWEINSLKTKEWLWKNIVLKLDLQITGGAYTLEATDIQENISVAEEKFKVPEDIEFQDINKALEKIPGI